MSGGKVWAKIDNDRIKAKKKKKYTDQKRYFCQHICYVTKHETYYISYVTIFET